MKVNTPCRAFLENCFKSRRKINLEDILSYKIKQSKDYSLGGFSIIESIDFHSRKLETIIEQTFIQIAIKRNKSVLNQRIYGHLQII